MPARVPSRSLERSARCEKLRTSYCLQGRSQTLCRAACAAAAAGRGFGDGFPSLTQHVTMAARTSRAGLRGFEARASGITVGKLRYKGFKVKYHTQAESLCVTQFLCAVA